MADKVPSGNELAIGAASIMVAAILAKESARIYANIET